MKKIIVILLLLPGIGGGLRAQFFKKILDNVKQTAQNKANSKAGQCSGFSRPRCPCASIGAPPRT